MKTKLHHVSFPASGICFFKAPEDDWRSMVSGDKGTPKISEAGFTYAALGDAVASFLPGKWTTSALWIRDPSSPILFTREDGFEIYVNFAERYPHKGKASATYRRPKNPGEASSVSVYHEGKSLPDPEIGFSRNKTPAEIARDIARRLIPDAEALHARVKAALSEQAAFIYKRNRTAEVAESLRGVAGFSFEGRNTIILVTAHLTPTQAQHLAALIKANPLPEDKE